MTNFLAQNGLWLLAFVIGAALFFLLGRRGQTGADAGLTGLVESIKAAQSELSGKISLVAESQSHLQKSVSEQLSGQNQSLQKNLEERLTDLKQRIAIFDVAQEKIGQLSQQVTSLQDVLSNKQARGAFGEVRLQDLVQDVLPPSLYSFQASLTNGARVDCLINLPNPPGPMGIDAKFPLESYRLYIAADNDALRRECAKKMEQDIKKHINDIAAKYILPGETSDSAILFLPSEAVFAELHVNFESLLQYAYRQKVWIVSPTTLMATMNTVRGIWRDVQLREQADEIQRAMHGLLADVSRLEERVGNLVRHYAQGEEDLRQIRTSTEKIARAGERIAAIEFTDTPAANEQIDKPLKLIK